ncbi:MULTISPECIES: YojF family protein [Bacillaceae]|uniref:YojF family protein n=1 Tax=Bacillus sp. SM2101 TaxID=2805366 RepID=UPI001BDF0427|nr:YojF family protein [Cytobacillus sp. IB215316]MDX8360108.1 YojF family protein [Cytobacillus sp. IB215316]
MKPIEKENVQEVLDKLLNEKLFVHLETTTGAYANHFDEKNMTVAAFIRNVPICFSQAKIKGPGPYRIGLKIEQGWVYAEGITDWEINDQSQVLLAGHDKEGRLAISLQLSKQPFNE